MDFKDFFLVGAGKKLEKAYIYIDSGKYDKARSLLEPAHNKEPQNTGLMLALLQCFVCEKNYPEASRMINKLLQTDKDIEHEILTLLKNAESQGEDTGPCLSTLADYRIKLRDLRNAFDHIDRISAASLEKERDKTAKQCKTILDKGAPGRAGIDVLYRFAMFLEKTKKHADMVKIFSAIVNADPSEIDNIASAINAAITRNFNLSPLRASLGDFFVRAGRIGNALSEYSKVLSGIKGSAPEIAEKLRVIHKNHPNDEPAAALLISALTSTGSIREAADTIESMADNEKHLPFAVEQATVLKRAAEDDRAVNVLFGRLCVKTGDIRKAVIAFSSAKEKGASHKELLGPLKDALKADPHNPKLNEMLGDFYAESGNCSKASGFYSRLVNAEGKTLTLFSKATELLNREPENKDVLLFAAAVCFKNSNITRGSLILRSLVKIDESLAEKALSMLPNAENNQLKLAKAEFLTILKRPKEALQLFSELSCEDGYPDRCAHLMVRMVKENSEFAQETDRIFSLDENSDVSLLARGEAACYAGNFSFALDILKSLIAKRPDAVPVVKALLEERLRANPSNDDIRFGLVDIYFSRELYDQITPILENLLKDSPGKAALVIDKYIKLLEKYPENARLMLGLSTAYILSGTPRPAVNCCLKALPFAKDDAFKSDIEETLAQAYFDCGELKESTLKYLSSFSKNNDKAENILKKLTEIRETDPSITESYLAMGRINAFLGKFEAGLKNYADCFEIESESGKQILSDIDRLYSSYAPSRIPAADICLKSGDIKRAVEYLRQVPETNFDLNRQAADRYNTVLQKFPSAPTAHLGLARCYTAMSLFEDAVSSYGKAFGFKQDLGPSIIKFLKDICVSNPALESSYHLICRIYLARNDAKSALNVIKSVPDNILKRFIKIHQLLTEIAETSTDSSSILPEIAGEFLRLGNTGKSIDFINISLNVPAPERSRINEMLDRILRDEVNARAYMLRGRLLIELASFENAVEDIRKAVQTDISVTEEALSLLDTIRSKAPGNFSALTLSIRLLDSLGRHEQLNGIFADLNIQSMKNEERSELSLLKAFHLENSGNNTEAEAVFREYYDSAGEIDEALRKVHLFILSESVRKAERTAAINPDVSEQIRNLARHFPAASIFKEFTCETLPDKCIRTVKALNRMCLSDCSEALKLLPQDMHIIRAFCLENTGQLAASCAQLEKIVELTDSENIRNKLKCSYNKLVSANLSRFSAVLTGRSSINFETEKTADSKPFGENRP